MADLERFSKYTPNKCQVPAENRRMPTVNFRRQGRPAQSVQVKMMRMFGSELNTVPKKRIVLHRPGHGYSAEQEKEKLKNGSHVREKAVRRT